MSPTHRLALVAALASAAGLAACNGNRNAGLMMAQTPDEFLVVARAPLVVPPDYALRPPMPGEPRPQELNPEATARSAIAGSRTTFADVSEGERAILMKAGADQAIPRIKEVIDDEQGDLAHKSKSFADIVMFWRKDAPRVRTTTETGAPVDPAAEAERLRSLTGGQQVTIVKAPPPAERRGIKLPGL